MQVVAQDWGVSRVGVASTMGVYFGTGADGALADGPLAEDLLPSIAPAHLPSPTH